MRAHGFCCNRQVEKAPHTQGICGAAGGVVYTTTTDVRRGFSAAAEHVSPHKKKPKRLCH
eukprot:4072282-Amphidinium_carterae.2